MSLRERTRPGLGIIEPYHARYSDFRRDPFTNHRGDVRLSFFRDGAPMTKPDRGELEVAAVVGAVLGGVTGYLLSNLVESGGWLKILYLGDHWCSCRHWHGFLYSSCSLVNAPRRFPPPWSVEEQKA